jgi:hypothetical protein
MYALIWCTCALLIPEEVMAVSVWMTKDRKFHLWELVESALSIIDVLSFVVLWGVGTFLVNKDVHRFGEARLFFALAFLFLAVRLTAVTYSRSKRIVKWLLIVLFCAIAVAGELYFLGIADDAQREYEANNVETGNTQMKQRIAELRSKGASPSKPPMLRPFEVSVKCIHAPLPVYIPVGGALRLVPLVHPWPSHVAITRLIDNRDTSPQQWPSSALLARSRDINDHLAVDCEIGDHGKADVLDLAIPFEYVFYGTNKPLNLNNKKTLEVDLNPLDVGAPVHIYFVNDCSEQVGLIIPKRGKGRLVGDRKTRDVQFELEPGSTGLALHGASFIGGWGQMSCS